jgi:hypothetical protein
VSAYHITTGSSTCAKCTGASYKVTFGPIILYRCLGEKPGVGTKCAVRSTRGTTSTTES